MKKIRKNFMGVTVFLICILLFVESRIEFPQMLLGKNHNIIMHDDMEDGYGYSLLSDMHFLDEEDE